MKFSSKKLLQEKDVKKKVQVKTITGNTYYNTEYISATEYLYLITKKCKRKCVLIKV